MGALVWETVLECSASLHGAGLPLVPAPELLEEPAELARWGVLGHREGVPGASVDSGLGSRCPVL